MCATWASFSSSAPVTFFPSCVLLLLFTGYAVHDQPVLCRVSIKLYSAACGWPWETERRRKERINRLYCAESFRCFRASTRCSTARAQATTKMTASIAAVRLLIARAADPCSSGRRDCSRACGALAPCRGNNACELALVLPPRRPPQRQLPCRHSPPAQSPAPAALDAAGHGSHAATRCCAEKLSKTPSGKPLPRRIGYRVIIDIE